MEIDKMTPKYKFNFANIKVSLKSIKDSILKVHDNIIAPFRYLLDFIIDAVILFIGCFFVLWIFIFKDPIITATWIYIHFDPLVFIFGIAAMTALLTYILISTLFSISKKNGVKLWISWIFTILMSLFIWYSQTNIIIQKFGLSLPYFATSTSTNTSSPIISPTRNTTINFTPSNTPKVVDTPTLPVVETSGPNSIMDLNICDFQLKSFPCRYKIIDGDSVFIISNNAYNARGYEGLIWNFYRNNKGAVKNNLVVNEYLLIPPKDQNPNEEYYNYYYKLLSPPINECKENSLDFPCWYKSKGETYYQLAQGFYPVPPSYTCMEDANYNIAKGLLIQSPKAGDIIILPDCS